MSRQGRSVLFFGTEFYARSALWPIEKKIKCVGCSFFRDQETFVFRKFETLHFPCDLQSAK